MPTNALPSPDARDLLAEAGWLRGLALRLVKDEARADDVVQETWRRALETPPRDRKALPAWLARTARNAAWEERRRDTRRRAREARVARPEAVSPVDDVVARTEIHRLLVDALLALEEPFRSTLLLRYIDDLAPKEIAIRTGVPAATVRTRLKRGLDRLRTRLDHAYAGKRRSWILPLVPWARGAGAGSVGTGTTLLGGTVAMVAGKKVWVALGVALALLVGAVVIVPQVLPRPRGAEGPQPSSSAADPREARDPLLVGRTPPEPLLTREPVALPVAPAAPWAVRGTVRTLGGEAVAHAFVFATLHQGGSSEIVARGRANAAGAFTLDCSSLAQLPSLQRAPAQLAVQAWADGFAPGPEDSWSVALERRTDLSDLALELVLQDGRVFAGRVVDTQGGVVARAEVRAGPVGEEGRIVARTRPDGTWRGRIPEPGRYAIRCQAAGTGTGEISPVDAVAGQDVFLPDLVLFGAGVLQGVASFPDGAPAAWVRITCYAALPQQFTDERGLLTSIATADGAGRFVLRGLKRGRYALRLEDARRSEDDPVYETGESDAVLEIRHRRVLVEVRDVEGEPLLGSSILGIWIHPDGTRDRSWRSHVDATGRHSFWLPVGDRLLVSADVPGSTYAEAAVDGAELPWDRSVVLTLREASEESGRVRVLLRADDGTPVTRMLVTLQTTVGETSLRGLYRVEPLADGLLPPVPVGTWTLDVLPGRGEEDPPLEPYFPVIRTVTVRPGETTEVEETLRRGGRVRLTVRPPAGSSLRPDDLTIAATSLSDRTPLSLGAWVATTPRGWRMGGLQLHEPCVGRTLLRPGTYLMSVEAPGFSRFERELAVAAGSIVDVTAGLEPETSGSPESGSPESKALEMPGNAPDLEKVRLAQMNWNDTPLTEIAAYLTGKLNLDLEFTERAEPLLAEARVFLTLDDIAASTLLDLCTGPYGLAWKIVGRTLWIGTADESLPPR